jgi:hypothetical protein
MASQSKVMEYVVQARETGETVHGISAVRENGKWIYRYGRAAATNAEKFVQEIAPLLNDNSVDQASETEYNVNSEKENIMDENQNETANETPAAEPNLDQLLADLNTSVEQNAASATEVKVKRTRATKLEAGMLESLQKASEKTGYKFTAERSDEVRYARALYDLSVDGRLVKKGLTFSEIELIVDAFVEIVQVHVEEPAAEVTAEAA